MSETQTLEPLLVDTRTAAKILGLSRSGFYQYSSSGQIGLLPVVSFGRKKLYSIKEIAAYVEAGAPNRKKWLQIKEVKQ